MTNPKVVNTIALISNVVFAILFLMAIRDQTASTFRAAVLVGIASVLWMLYAILVSNVAVLSLIYLEIGKLLIYLETGKKK